MSEMNNDPMKALWQSQTTEVPSMQFSYLRHRAEELEKSLRFRSVLEQGACFVGLIVCAVIIAFEQEPWKKLGAAMLLVGTSYALFQWRRRTLSKSVRSFEPASAGLEFYRRELERRRDIHRTAWLWYGLPIFIPATAFLILGMVYGDVHANDPWLVIGLIVVSIILSLVYERTQVAKFQREIDALTSLDANGQQQ